MRKRPFSTRSARRLSGGLLSAVILAGLCLPARAVTKMTLSQIQDGLAYASTQTVEVDGRAVEFQMYALKDENGYDTNYVKLRDVACILDRTPARFNVEWSGEVRIETGADYVSNGSEMYTPYRGDRPYTRPGGATVIDGRNYRLDAILLKDDRGGGYTYYKLRALGDALGFTVDWSRERGVYIETSPAAEEEPSVEDLWVETPQPPEPIEDAPREEEAEGQGEDQDAPVPFENNAYIILTLDTVTGWEEAYAYCAEQGGHLATIDSQAENEHVRALLDEAEVSSAFLGASEEEGFWSWYNGFPLRYSNWASGQPGGGVYAAMDRDGTWSAKSFSGGASFICEWDQ